jgi:hypothetical protein
VGQSEDLRIRTELDGSTLGSINEYILREAGGDFWHVPPKEKVLESGAYPIHQQYMQEFMGGFQGSFYGMKDPRLSITLPAWLPLLEQLNGDLYVYAAFRKRKRVVESMKRKRHDRFCDVDELVRQYNERTLENIRLFLEL